MFAPFKSTFMSILPVNLVPANVYNLSLKLREFHSANRCIYPKRYTSICTVLVSKSCVFVISNKPTYRTLFRSHSPY